MVIEVNFPNNFKKEATEAELETIKEKLIAEDDWATEYNTENEDCLAAEFVGSFYYGEVDRDEVLRPTITLIEDVDRLFIKDEWTDIEDDQKSGLIKALKTLDAKSLYNALDAYTSLNCERNYRNNWNTILGQSVGELETQISCELIETINKLPQEQVEYLEHETGYIHRYNCIYTPLDSYIWCLDLDVEELFTDYLNGDLSL